MRLIIAGSRHLRGPKVLFFGADAMNLKYSVTEVVSGTCVGADAYGEQWANLNSIPIKQFPAQWSVFGNAAGPIRNKAMVEYADGLLVVRRQDSRGSAHVLTLALQKGIPVLDILLTDDGETEISFYEGTNAETIIDE